MVQSETARLVAPRLPVTAFSQIFLLICLLSHVYGQNRAQASITDLDYEVGVPTVGSIGTEVIFGCFADDLSRVADWGEGAGEVALKSATKTIILDGKNPAVPPGTYALSTTHVYRSAGPHHLTVFERAHCYKETHRDDFSYSFSVMAYPRSPVNEIVSDKKSAKSGESVTFTVTINPPASKAGARVDLTQSVPALSGFPKFITVPPFANQQTLSAIVLTKIKRAVTITASTVGEPRKATLIVRP